MSLTALFTAVTSPFKDAGSRRQNRVNKVKNYMLILLIHQKSQMEIFLTISLRVKERKLTKKSQGMVEREGQSQVEVREPSEVQAGSTAGTLDLLRWLTERDEKTRKEREEQHRRRMNSFKS